MGSPLSIAVGMAICPLPLIQGAAIVAWVLMRLDPGRSHRRPASALQGLGALCPQVCIRKGVDLSLAPKPPELAEPPNHGHRVR
eukprot:593813-Alexandrium_andersonii.AAC.1